MEKILVAEKQSLSVGKLRSPNGDTARQAKVNALRELTPSARAAGTSPKSASKILFANKLPSFGFGGGRVGVALLPSILDKAFKGEL